MKALDLIQTTQVNDYLQSYELEAIKAVTKKEDTHAIMSMKRVEMKYILTKEQLDYLIDAIKGHMVMDKYGLTSIASIYYDTPNHQLIRNSIEKPHYKEKVRVRSYGLSYPGATVYLELKRKINGITYKRRVALDEITADNFLKNKGDIGVNGQIANEITYFRDLYQKLIPAYLLIADRVAYYQPHGDIRLTIDRNPRYRTTDLNLTSSMEGTPLLDNGGAILEIKVQQAMPLWLTEILSKGKIYKSSFSKVGEAYKKEMKAQSQERM